MLAHARALLTSSDRAGTTAYLNADLREPEAILAHPSVTATLDLTRPVGLMLVAVLHFLTDEEQPHAAVRTLLDALAPGSYLVLTHAARDYLPPGRATDGAVTRTHSYSGIWMRSLADIARFCAGLSLVPPGLVPTAEWHADHEPSPRPSAADVATACAVARVPGGVDTTATR